MKLTHETALWAIVSESVMEAEGENKNKTGTYNGSHHTIAATRATYYERQTQALTPPAAA